MQSFSTVSKTQLPPSIRLQALHVRGSQSAFQVNISVSTTVLIRQKAMSSLVLYCYVYFSKSPHTCENCIYDRPDQHAQTIGRVGKCRLVSERRLWDHRSTEAPKLWLGSNCSQEEREESHFVVLGPVSVRVPPSTINSSSSLSSRIVQSMAALDSSRVVSPARGRERFSRSSHSALT